LPSRVRTFPNGQHRTFVCSHPASGAPHAGRRPGSFPRHSRQRARPRAKRARELRRPRARLKTSAEKASPRITNSRGSPLLPYARDSFDDVSLVYEVSRRWPMMSAKGPSASFVRSRRKRPGYAKSANAPIFIGRCALLAACGYMNVTVGTASN
jgi:hypothetical protein